MKINNMLKYSGLAALVLSVAVGCATTPKQNNATGTQGETVNGSAAASAPASQPASAPVQQQAAATESSKPGSYKVVHGDCLWQIAGKSDIYGNPYEWPLIYKANHDKIKDADLIFPGQVFTINRDASSADIAAAVQHAKTRGAWTLGKVEASDTAYLAQ